MVDTDRLRAAVKESGLKYGYIAKRLALSYQGLQNKIENKTEFLFSEAVAFAILLNIASLNEREMIFFKQKVEK
jgi:hypothetical protein